jgi:hypothetical protein
MGEQSFIRPQKTVTIKNKTALNYWEKVRTTNFTTSKTKKNIKKVGDNHYIKKIYKRDQNVKKG